MNGNFIQWGKKGENTKKYSKVKKKKKEDNCLKVKYFGKDFALYKCMEKLNNIVYFYIYCTVVKENIQFPKHL